MLLTTLFIVGHIEIGGGYCRTDLMLPNKVLTTMEYPCEYYGEFKDADEQIKKFGV